MRPEADSPAAAPASPRSPPGLLDEPTPAQILLSCMLQSHTGWISVCFPEENHPGSGRRRSAARSLCHILEQFFISMQAKRKLFERPSASMIGRKALSPKLSVLMETGVTRGAPTASRLSSY
jgi:hypothetical protein